MSRRAAIIAAVVIVAALALICALWGRSLTPQTMLPTPTPLVEAEVEEAPVTAEGVIVPLKEARLSFAISGVLKKIHVQEGDYVQEGQLLAELDSTDLELAVRAAEDALALAEAQLAQLKAPPRPEEIAIAEAAYKSALAQYNKLKAGPSEEEIKMAEAALKKAEAVLRQAQAAYDKIAWMPDAALMPQALQLEQATLDYQSALANYRLQTKGPSPEDLEVAWRNVESAKAQLELKKAGPRPEDVAVAEARVRQARTSLEQAKANLEKARLLAPFTGTVVSITANEGELVSPGSPVLVLADLSAMRVQTTDLDEWDAAKVRVGQKAKITVNAFEDKVLTGEVVDIALKGVTLETGDVAYTVTVKLDEQDPELRWGMTVKVEFVE